MANRYNGCSDFEKVFNITNGRQMQIKTAIRYQLRPIRMAVLKKTER